MVWPYGSEEDRRKVLNRLNEWIAKENRLSEWRGIIDTVLNRIEVYEKQWENDPGNLFPVELLQAYLKDQTLEDNLRGDHKAVGLLNTKYSREGVRNFNAMLNDFKRERSDYLSNHPWPFIDPSREWRKPNLQITEDVEAICVALSICHDLVIDSYPILTEQQIEKIGSLQYPSCCISINDLENYVVHTKLKSPKHKTKEKPKQQQLPASRQRAIDSLIYALCEKEALTKAQLADIYYWIMDSENLESDKNPYKGVREKPKKEKTWKSYLWQACIHYDTSSDKIRETVEKEWLFAKTKGRSTVYVQDIDYHSSQQVD